MSIMIRNYLKVGFRSLWRTPSYTVVNMAGLGIAVACCILIALYVQDELTFDRFHSKAERIYRVFAREDWGDNEKFFYTTTPFPMGPTLKENIHGIEEQVRICPVGTQVRHDDAIREVTVTIGGVAMFDVFDFNLVRGKKEDVFAHQNNLVLSEAAAEMYFGDADPVGKALELRVGSDEFETYVVSGVAKVPRNSSIRFSLMIPDLNLPKLYSNQALTSGWFSITPETYVLLAEGVTADEVVEKFPALFRTILGEEAFTNSKYSPGLQALTDIHLNPDFPAGIAPVNDPRYVYILSGIALLILVVACINFVTLSMGRSIRRSREVGVRKVVGADRRQLVFQFLGEGIIITLVALLAGIIVSFLVLPTFNELAGKELQFGVNSFLVAVLVILLVVIGILAGSYPAIALSSLRPAVALKGEFEKGQGKQGTRKFLVAFQLILSIFLISSTLIMRNQLRFLQEKDLGYNDGHVLAIPMKVPSEGRLASRVAKGFERAALFKSALSKHPGVQAVCAASHDFGTGAWTNVGFTDDEGIYRTFNLNIVDEDYIPAMEMSLLSGRAFSIAIPADARRGVIVNEAFVEMFGWTDALGKRIPGKNFDDHEIIGVLKDFHYAALYTSVEPLVVVVNANIILPGIENVNFQGSPFPKLMVRIDARNVQKTIADIEAEWQRIEPGEEFVFSFVDENLARQYEDDRRLGRVATVSTVLAMIIAMMGLYALATLAMQARVREISIRKVFGATEGSLLFLVSREYVVLIVVCLVFSIPMTLSVMKEWLSAFAYRVDISVVDFGLAGLVTLMVTLLSIAYRALLTVASQPASTLRGE